MCAARSQALGGGGSGASATLAGARDGGAVTATETSDQTTSVSAALESKETAHDASDAQQSRAWGAPHSVSSLDGALSGAA